MAPNAAAPITASATDARGDVFDSITPTEYRQLMSSVPTSIVVAASMSEGSPIGMVIGTFASVSMHPPLVGFFGDHRSRTLGPLLEAGALSFGLLRQEDLALCDAFRGPLEHRFDNLGWRVSEHGTPQLDDAILTVHTRIHEIVDAGDHRCVLGEVIDVVSSRPSARPLLFYKHQLMRMDAGQMLDDEMWQLGLDDEWGRSEWG